MVTDSNAVVDPGAVVVEAFYTYIADCTVTGAWCTDDEAVWTEIGWTKALH